MSKKHVVIIGGGIGGLATANILAKAGYKVDVYEKNSQLGGRAGMLKVKGFSFDTGPSWYLMPEAYDQYFSLFGYKTRDLLDLVRLDPAYKVYFGPLAKPEFVRSNVRSNRKLFGSLETDGDVIFDRYLSRSELAYNVSVAHFLYNPFTSNKTLANRDILRHVPSLVSLTARSLHSYTKSYFKNQRAQQLLEYPAVFLGASPYMAPALFSLMSYLDCKQGVYYPMGGMYTIVDALRRIGGELGVSYHINTHVDKIVVDNGKATGVMVGKEFVAAEIVVSNADLHHTETKLIEKTYQSYPDSYWDKAKAGPSAILIYLGVKGQLPQLEHHNLYFVNQWESNFKDTFEHKIWSQPASLYVCKPSATDPSVAPNNHENVFLLVPGPATELTATELKKLANYYIEQLADRIEVPDLRSRIVYQSQRGPNDFKEQYYAWQGTALGMAHTLRQSAFFRPSNKSKKVSNLYYAGAGTQPGIGVPLCLMSAELVYKHIIGDHSSGPLKPTAFKKGNM